MSSTNAVSKQTRSNWLVDAAVFISALAATLSGVYFLYLPVGGYQGGRNPLYGVTILFDRHTWENVHTWGGVAMIAAAAIHLAIHTKWVLSMARRMGHTLAGRGPVLTQGGWLNLLLNSVVALSFGLTALTGLYLLWVPGGQSAQLADPRLLFGRATWDLLHTWAAVVLIVAASVHIVIHWRWIARVTPRVLLAGVKVGTVTPQPEPVRAHVTEGS
jgi:hypothetical protein